jgi:opacity protein-like surface antigen
MKKVLFSAVILSAMMSSAQALEGPYVGFGYNIDNISYNDDNFDVSEGTASAIHLSTGYNLNRYIGVEIRTLIGATGTESGNYSPDCVQADQPRVEPNNPENENDVQCQDDVPVSEIKFNSSASINLKLGVPVAQYVTLLGKVGYTYSDYTVETKFYNSDTEKEGVNRGAGNNKVSVYGESNFYGVGLGFEMKSGSQIEVMYNQNYKEKGITHNSIQLGYNYNY